MTNSGEDIPAFEADPLSEVDFDAKPKLILNAAGELVLAEPEPEPPPPEPMPEPEPDGSWQQPATFAHLLAEDGLVVVAPDEEPTADTNTSPAVIDAPTLREEREPDPPKAMAPPRASSEIDAVEISWADSVAPPSAEPEPEPVPAPPPLAARPAVAARTAPERLISGLVDPPKPVTEEIDAEAILSAAPERAVDQEAPPPTYSITDDLMLEPDVTPATHAPIPRADSEEVALELTDDDVVDATPIPDQRPATQPAPRPYAAQPVTPQQAASMATPPARHPSTRTQSHLSRSHATVRPVSASRAPTERPTPAPARPPARRVPSVVGRRVIREKNCAADDTRRTNTGQPTTTSKGEPFFERGIRALGAGDLVNAERDIALALSYAPSDPRYRQAFEELKRRKGR